MPHTMTVFTLAALMVHVTGRTVTAAEAGRERAIEHTAAAYLKSMLAADAAGASATFRDDAVLMPPCRPMLKGRTAIEQYYRGLFDGGAKITEFSFPQMETSASGDVGYAAGTYKQKLLLQPAEPVEDSGKFVAILKREGGTWKTAYLIYNSDLPPVQPEAAAPAVILPWSALKSYYAVAGLELLTRLGGLALACMCVALLVWLGYSELKSSQQAGSASAGLRHEFYGDTERLLRPTGEIE